MSSLRKVSACDVGSAFRCYIKNICCPFCSNLQKGYFFMKNSRRLCLLGMLCALTIVLGFYATWRIGPTIKISLKFCPVMVAGSMFGPLAGGVVGSVSDIASFVANPAGGFLPLITLAEFLYGVLYGLFFFKKNSRALSVLICVCTQAVILDALFKSFALSIMTGSAFFAMLVSRLPAVGVNFAIQLAGVYLIRAYLPLFKKMLKVS